MSLKVRINRNAKGVLRHQSSKQSVRDRNAITEHTHPAVIIQRARFEPESLTPREVLQLQRTIGNQAVQRLLGQAEPADLEARSNSGVEVPPTVHEVLRSPGQPLDNATRAFMEPRFAHDFNQVRVHADSRAAASAQSINARAYTAGNHIVFREGEYAPTSTNGRRLLAHELTHTLQQGEQLQSPSNHTAQAPAARSIQRQSPRKTSATPQPAAAPTPTKTAPLKGLSRTLYVVNNDVWQQLPSAVRISAEQELGRLFTFVGKASGEKPFSVKIVTAAQLPEQFDFSESVVSVIHGDPDTYVKEALDRQRAQAAAFLKQRNVSMPTPPTEGKSATTPEKIGSGGTGRSVTKSFAIPIMAGAVSIEEVVSTFLDNVDSNLAGQMEKLPERGRNPAKWPPIVKSKRGTTSYQPLEMFGAALGRAIAHEARHEYMGATHSKTGLGQESAIVFGEKNSANFSEADQKAMLEQLRKLETQQGKATVVPTFPTSARSKPELFPF